MIIQSKAVVISFYAFGVLLGVWYLSWGLGAWFSISQEHILIESLNVYSGPLSFLPALLVGVVFRNAGAAWFFIGAAVFGVTSGILDKNTTDLFRDLIGMSVPMILFGGGLTLLHRTSQTVQATVRAATTIMPR